MEHLPYIVLGSGRQECPLFSAKLSFTENRLCSGNSMSFLSDPHNVSAMPMPFSLILQMVEPNSELRQVPRAS